MDGWMVGLVGKWTIGRTSLYLSSDPSLKLCDIKYQDAHNCTVRFILLRLSQISELLFISVRVFRIELPSDTWLYFRPLLCPAKAKSDGLSSVPTLGNFLTETLYQPWKVRVPSGTPPSPFWLSSTLAHTPPNTAFDHEASLIPAEYSSHCLIHAAYMQA